MIKILITHMYPLIRAGLSASLMGVNDLEIVGNTAEPDEIAACLREMLSSGEVFPEKTPSPWTPK